MDNAVNTGKLGGEAEDASSEGPCGSGRAWDAESVRGLGQGPDGF